MGLFKKLTKLDNILTELPRGGYLVDTSEGYIQFGSPPETLKDTYYLPKGVPSIFILPIEHFDPKLGMSVAEIEFPIYYNYFIKKRKTKIYLNKEHIDNMIIVLKESIFGPENIDLTNDINFNSDEYFEFDLVREMKYFSANNKLENMVDLYPLDPNGIIIGNVCIIRDTDNGFLVYESNKKIAKVPSKIKFNPVFQLGKTINELFIPPQFGITCLGPSHGFDPEQNTSGFILWINKVGIMVDPPANSTLWLKESNVNPKYIDSIILTHCHADHDAGTFQKILEEKKVNIYTTPTIIQSFLTKYSALTRIPPSTLLNLFNFCPVKMFSEYNIHGAIFKFFYTLHSIPTIGFKFNYRDKSFVYSSDHLNYPDKIIELYNLGIINDKRKEFLLNFPWDSDIIYHEAGIPPLHTPISYLQSLPKEIQEKITVYHIAEKDFPKNTFLKLAKFGIGETVYPDIQDYKYEEAYNILDVFSRIEVFKDLPFDRIKDLLLIVKKENFKKGDYIIKKDTPGDKFYVIISGNVSVNGIENINDKVYASYEYFGEVSLVTGSLRKADVIAITDVEAYSIDKSSFLRLIENTKVEKNILKIASIRNGHTWSVLKTNDLFKTLSSSQITQLESYLIPEIKNIDEILFKENDIINCIYIIDEGRVGEYLNNELIKIYNKGDIAGNIIYLKDNIPSKTTLKVIDEKVSCYKIEKKDVLKFINDNPGFYMNILFEKPDNI